MPTRNKSQNSNDYLRSFNQANLQLLDNAIMPQASQAPGAAGNGNSQAALNAFAKQTTLAQTTISELQQDLKENEMEHENLTEKHEELKGQFSEMKLQMDKIVIDIAELRKTTSEQIEQLTKEKLAAETSLTEVQGKLTLLTDDHEAVKKEKDDLQVKLTQSEKDLADAKKDATDAGAAALGLENKDKSKSTEQGDNETPTENLSAAQIAEKAKAAVPGSPEAQTALLKSTIEKNREFKETQKFAGTTNSMQTYLQWRHTAPEGANGKTNEALVKEAIHLGY